MYHYCHRILYIFHVWTHEKKNWGCISVFFCGTHLQLGSLNELIIYILYFSPLKYLPRCDVAFNYNLCKTIILLVMFFWNEGICSTSIWLMSFIGSCFSPIGGITWRCPHVIEESGCLVVQSAHTRSTCKPSRRILQCWNYWILLNWCYLYFFKWDIY